MAQKKVICTRLTRAILLWNDKMMAELDGRIGIELDKHWFGGDKVELRLVVLLFWGKKSGTG
jgi:hypothetical protein